MSRAIAQYRSTFLAIIGLLVAAVLVGGYVLVHQRLHLPIKDKYYSVQIELPNSQAITPGQGQTVNVAGVQVGEIGKVTLRDGRALVKLEINKKKLPEVHTDATALTRPKTPLDDMSVELDPGSAKAPRLTKDDILPVSRSTPNINPDQILSALDSDTRPYLQGLVKGLGDGVGKDRGVNLRKFFKVTAPTLKSTRELTAAIRGRRVALRQVVHNLSLLTDRLGPQSADLQRLIASANGTFSALAAEDNGVRGTLAELPGTLRQADTALAAAKPLANQLTPTLDGLAPALKALPGALRSGRTLAKKGTKPVQQVRAFTQSGQPLASTADQALSQLKPTLPDLSTTMDVLNYVGNETAFNPPGKQEGYLFWLDWFAHNTNSMLSTRDANGGWWRGQVIFSCSNIDALGLLTPILSPAAKAGVCPK